MPAGVRFEVLGRVPSGASGQVWKARDAGLDRVVALKEITGQSAAEARALAALSSPHVVQVFGVVEDAGRVYLVEEWVDGAPLSAVLRAAGRLSTAQALGVIRGALLGLAATHRAGLVHGDVSASNILVDAAGTSKLIDFGSVVRIGDRARASTGAYAAPEVLGGGMATPASDVFAAAAVLATLMHGRLEPRPSTRGVDDGVRPVLDRALDGNPGGRYRDAAEFLAALEAASQRRYGPAWFTEAGLGALATAAGAGLVTAGLAAVPFGGATVAGAGTSAAAAGTSPFGIDAPPAPPDPLGPHDPFGTNAAAALARRRRLGLLTGGGVLVAAAVVIVVVLASGGGGHHDAAADIIHPTPSPVASASLPPAPTPTPTHSQPATQSTTTVNPTPTPTTTSGAAPLDIALTAGKVTIGYQVVQQCDGCPELQSSGVAPLPRIPPGYIKDQKMSGGAFAGDPGTGNAFDIEAPFKIGNYNVISEEPGQDVALTISVRIPYLDPALNERTHGQLVIGGIGHASPNDPGCEVSIVAADENGFSGRAQCPGLNVGDGQYVVNLDTTYDFNQ